MQIVIDIPDKVYGLLRYFRSCIGSEVQDGDDVKTVLVSAVANGTPLPKGHGRLIDFDELLYDMGAIITLENIERITTIIEADKGDSDACRD